MPGFVGFPELLLLGLVVLLVFGPKRLPEMGRSLGRGMREFKSSVTGGADNEDRFVVPQEPVVAVTPEPVREREVA
jgi:sec-independent protein translocase protein TatA